MSTTFCRDCEFFPGDQTKGKCARLSHLTTAKKISCAWFAWKNVKPKDGQANFLRVPAFVHEFMRKMEERAS